VLPEGVAEPRPLFDERSGFEERVDPEDPTGGRDADDDEQHQSHQVTVKVAVSPVGVPEEDITIRKPATKANFTQPAWRNQ